MNATSNSLSLLKVSEEACAEVAPASAFVHVVLTADRFFSGRAALEKAEELRRLAVALEAAGLPGDALALEGASLDVSSGVFVKSSSVTYRLRIHVKELDLLADVLDAIAACKKAKLTHLTWDYPESAPASLVRECAARAASKAETLAVALGITLRSIHAVRDEHHHELPPVDMLAAGYGAPMAMRARSAASSSVAYELGGLELTPKKKVTARVYVDYVIAPPPSA